MPSLLSLLLGSALALAPGQLLERHKPVVVLHPLERSAPTAVEGFLADAQLVGGSYDVRACARRLYSIQPTMISVIANASIAKPVR